MAPSPHFDGWSAVARRLGGAVLALALFGSACGSSPTSTVAVDTAPTVRDIDPAIDPDVRKGGDEVESALEGTLDETSPSDDADAGETTTDRPAIDRDASPFASQITQLGSAGGLDDLTASATGPVPIALDLPSIGVEGALVTPVGVEANGDMVIPGADEVGWYEFGPTPGAATGSAVLAAHIAFNGVDGVFRNLDDMEPGDEFDVVFDDGTRESFLVIGLRQWSKQEIPLDDLFARDGTPRLVLITCGGSFNRALDSYDDNVVVISIPVDFATSG